MLNYSQKRCHSSSEATTPRLATRGRGTNGARHGAPNTVHGFDACFQKNPGSVGPNRDSVPRSGPLATNRPNVVHGFDAFFKTSALRSTSGPLTTNRPNVVHGFDACFQKLPGSHDANRDSVPHSVPLPDL